MTFHIETERLILREMRPEDDAAMLELNSDPVVMHYLGEKTYTNIEQIREMIANIRQQYADHGIGRWAAIEKSSGAFIGWSGLKFITAVENNRTHFHDVGYRLIPRYWGKGYATESGSAALEYGFRTLHLQEIIGMCNEQNLASRRVLEKCGLTFIEKFMWDDTRYDWLKITPDEWKLRKK
jgi:ribosomal-protein-alanine N-acetyltransferase